ncbi:PIN domain nuclease [Haloarcula sp. S1CR25-12]|uniref:PIN domain nuclease n=1 Tax=Haloarcula saliterrae TaxID=2950534 RepID=A0ABU2FA93_9EURY|nr:PIN domain nuclease [Haloarcula sp. S1CR25-12]MDS0259200.1 PIN domain nuclease [Haloarcula sp. S1CR25-12]
MIVLDRDVLVKLRNSNRTVIQHLRSSFDRILPFTIDTAYLDEKLQSQGVTLDPVDLLNLATAQEAGGTFVTHNRNDFDRGPVRDIADVDVVLTE